MDNFRETIVSRFPPLSTATLELLHNLEDSLSLHQIGDILERDPTMAAEVIRVANSPLFRRANEVADARQAAVVLGTAVVRRMAMRLGLERSLRVAGVDELFPIVWKHSVATGELARALANGLGVAGNVAYTAGLLSDIGVIGLAASSPDTYSQVEQASKTLGFELVEWERQHFGVDHRRVASWIAIDWQLPRQLTRAIIHKTGEVAEDSFQNIVAAASSLASVYGFGLLGRDDRDEEQILAAHRLSDLVDELPETFELETVVIA